MSEKDHSVKEFVKKIAARIRKDLFQYRTALFAVAGYFLFMHVAAMRLSECLSDGISVSCLWSDTSCQAFVLRKVC